MYYRLSTIISPLFQVIWLALYVLTTRLELNYYERFGHQEKNEIIVVPTERLPLNYKTNVKIMKKSSCNTYKTPAFFIGQNMQLCDVLVAEVAYGLFFILLVLNEQSWPGTKILHYAREIRHPTLTVANLSKCCVHFDTLLYRPKRNNDVK